MSKRNRIAATVSATIMAGSVVFAAAGSAQAAPIPIVNREATALTLVAKGPSATQSRTSGSQVAVRTPNAPVTPAHGTRAAAKPMALPVVVRIAVRAALEVLKKTNKTWYNNVISAVKKGRAAFATWWNTKVPQWVKNIFGGFSAYEIFDAIRWILGI